MISDVRKLRSLREVAHRGTVTRAAEALGYTPSAVSQQLSSLEAELGVAVLERRGRRVELTDAGRLLVHHATAILEALEGAETALAELRDEPVGPVRIGTLASAAATILPVALRALRAESPRVEPEVVVRPRARSIPELRLGAIDVAIDETYEFAPGDRRDDLSREVLLREPLLLSSPASSPLDRVVDGGDRDWIASPAETACGRSTRAILEQAGLDPRIRYEVEDHEATVRLVAAGLGVAIVPRLAMRHHPTDVHVATLADVHRTISAVTRPSNRTRPAVTAVVDHLRRAAHDQVVRDQVA